MAVYFPIKGATKVTTGVFSAPNQVVQPLGQNNPNSPAGQHSLEVVTNGIGNCSSSVQFYGSNDGVSFFPYGPLLTATGTAADLSPGVSVFAGTQSYTYIGAVVTAISGTNASVTASISA